MRLIKFLIVTAVIGGGALLAWMFFDPDAGEKIKGLLDNVGAVIIIVIFLWVFISGKSKRRSGSNHDYDDYDDNDFDGDDD